MALTSKRIMFAGPHCIGKSTTAEQLAARFPEFLYIPSFVSRLAKDNGYDLNSNPTPTDVLGFQKKVLKAFSMHYQITDEVPTIYDRSPLDFAAYTMLELDHTELYASAIKYKYGCIERTNSCCDILIIPQADLDLAYEDKYNRPSFSEDQKRYRKQFAQNINEYARHLVPNIEVIRVPKEYQFEDRIDYICEKLREKKLV